MKKLLWTLLAVCTFLGIGLGTAYASDCLNLKFNNWDSLCLEIEKNGNKNFKIAVDKNNLNKGSSIKCYIILPNSSVHTLNDCAWNFSYPWSNTEDVIVSATYVLKNGNFYSKRLNSKLNFNKWTWTSSNDTSNSSKSSSKNNSNGDIKVSVSPSNPDTYEWVKLTIETDDDYTGKINFSKFQYKSSNSSSWSTISSRTSSTYVSDYSTAWSNGYYKMTSSDDGYVTLKNLVKFKKSGYYRIYVEDTDGNESYVQINVDTSSSSSNSNDDIKVSVSPSNPDTYEWVKLTIETDDDYTGKINFSKFQYKSSNSSSWSTISSRTSSTYVSDYSTAWSNGYYKMTSSDDGYVTLKNLVKFKKSGYYRIYVEDTDGNESYVQINVDTSSSSSNSNDDIELSTNRQSPSTSQYINLTIETDDDYTGKLSLSAKYRKSSSDSRSSISNTSSTYFSNYSDEWENGYYKMKSSDNGEISLNNLVKFKKTGYYRIYVKDIDWNENYIQFNVGNIDNDYEESNINWFTESELAKVKSVYKWRNNAVNQMKIKYPSLKRDTYRIKLSENFYNDMEDVINNKKYRDFNDYNDYLDAYNERYKYTTRNI